MARFTSNIALVAGLVLFGLWIGVGLWLSVIEPSIDATEPLQPNSVVRDENLGDWEGTRLRSELDTSLPTILDYQPSTSEEREEVLEESTLIEEYDASILGKMTGAEIAALSDDELDRVPIEAISNQAITRYSSCEPVEFLSSTSLGTRASYSHVWAGAVDPDNVPPDAYRKAKLELVRLRDKIQQVVDEERKSPAFIESVPFRATERQRKRSMASWCLYAQRIEERARPFMNQSETVVLAIFEIHDVNARLRW